MRKISARALSLASGLSPSYINKLENGSLEPSFTAFCKIVQSLEITDAEILFLVRRVK